MARSKSPTYREITTSSGRTYRVGEDPKQILGRSRNSMIWLPWIAMMAAGVFEYAYGSAAKTLQTSYGWTSVDAFTLTGVWGFFQAGVALPAGRLREKNLFSPKAAMLLGAVLSLVAFVIIGYSGDIVLDVIGYGVLGGTGTGLVYATCINIVGKWFPEGKGSRVGFVNGGFAYGSIPSSSSSATTSRWLTTARCSPSSGSTLRFSSPGPACSSRTRRRTGGPLTSTQSTGTGAGERAGT
jgi:hypothetical protein